MRAAVVVTGVLGMGTVLVFALAGLVASLFPNGTLVNAGWNGGCMDCGRVIGAPGIPVPMPAPAIGVPEKGFVVDDGSGVGPNGTDGDLLPQP